MLNMPACGSLIETLILWRNDMPEWVIVLLLLGGSVGSFIIFDVWIHKDIDNYNLMRQDALKEAEEYLKECELACRNSDHYKKTQAMKQYKERQK
jgi:hypothetical protein